MLRQQYLEPYPIGSMYGIYIYANIGGIVMVNVTIYGIHGSYGYRNILRMPLSRGYSWLP